MTAARAATPHAVGARATKGSIHSRYQGFTTGASRKKTPKATSRRGMAPSSRRASRRAKTR
ncbi:MAG: hypothetical protein ACYTAF_17265 [Planctomycetota bacterium]